MPENTSGKVIAAHMSAQDTLRALTRGLIENIDSEALRKTSWTQGHLYFFEGNTRKLDEISESRLWSKASFAGVSQDGYRMAVLDKLNEKLKYVAHRISNGDVRFSPRTNDLIFIGSKAALVNLSTPSRELENVVKWYRAVREVTIRRSISDPGSLLRNGKGVLHMTRVPTTLPQKELGRLITITHERADFKAMKPNTMWFGLTKTGDFTLADGPVASLDLRPNSVSWNNYVIEFNLCDEIESLRRSRGKSGLRRKSASEAAN